MSETINQNPAINRDEIAKTAWQIWQQEGCQGGRDQEYWLRAEQQLRAASQQGNGQTKKTGAKRNNGLAKGTGSARA